jgi:hypothetical protein
MSKGATTCILRRASYELDICDEISAQISQWKHGAVVTQKDCDESLQKMILRTQK